MSINRDALAGAIYNSIEQNDFSVLENAWDTHNPTPNIEASQLQSKDIRVQIIKLDSEKKRRERLEAEQGISTYSFWLWFHQQKTTFKYTKPFLSRSHSPYISEQEEVSALMAAVERRQEKQVEFFLENCPPDLLPELLMQQTQAGHTVLHLAAMGSSTLIVAMLIDHYKKANLPLDAQNSAGKTALELAALDKIKQILTPPSDALIAPPTRASTPAKPTVKSLISSMNHSNAAQEIQNAYTAALAQIGQYHGALQRCVRKIDARIGELQIEILSSKSILCRDIKRKKIRYLSDLRKAFDDTSHTAPDTHPTAVIQAFKEKPIAESDLDKTPYAQRYDIIIKGNISKRTSDLLAHLVGAKSSHEYLIERDAAHLVCKHLIKLLTKESEGKPLDPLKRNKILALEKLCTAIKDVGQFNKSVAELAYAFESDPLYKDLIKGTNSRGYNLMRLLGTLLKKCEVEIRVSMQLNSF